MLQYWGAREQRRSASPNSLRFVRCAGTSRAASAQAIAIGGGDLPGFAEPERGQPDADLAAVPPAHIAGHTRHFRRAMGMAMEERFHRILPHWFNAAGSARRS
ncbi:hypothetical protein N0Q91_01795 (plasmid) [Sinorhizobium sp. K101]|uniref:hypothetical protein n=1 Tax=unclassified Sinorhizobium TaxID=2613772 RepID=UPI0023D88369|nr:MULTISPECIES: hypothetical protein [unclassified Sinorhizobium]WEJ08694.1 hypothetical protein N0Q90_00895 [Sinorhizobium sp. M103]WEJ13804.1 hypothetical protein N0Q91_01795 [Sinorhizobium sp. K101]